MLTSSCGKKRLPLNRQVIKAPSFLTCVIYCGDHVSSTIETKILFPWLPGREPEKTSVVSKTDAGFGANRLAIEASRFEPPLPRGVN
jgi:hypothetical protein